VTRGGINFNIDDARQLAKAKEAFKHVLGGVARANANINKMVTDMLGITREDETRWETWFGPVPTAQDMQTVRRTYYHMQRQLTSKEVIVTTTDLFGDCDPGVNAYVAPPFGVPDPMGGPNIPGTLADGDCVVVLCRDWFNLPLWGGSSQTQTGTLIHELSHKIGNTDDHNLSDGTTAYGANAAKELAKEDPALARNNAENYNFFAQSLLA